MKTNGHTTLKIGMKVIYRGSWGYDAPSETAVEYIELCDMEGCKYGEPVDEVAVNDIKRCCVLSAVGTNISCNFTIFAV